MVVVGGSTPLAPTTTDPRDTTSGRRPSNVAAGRELGAKLSIGVRFVAIHSAWTRQGTRLVGTSGKLCDRVSVTSRCSFFRTSAIEKKGSKIGPLAIRFEKCVEFLQGVLSPRP